MPRFSQHYAITWALRLEDLRYFYAFGLSFYIPFIATEKAFLDIAGDAKDIQ